MQRKILVYGALFVFLATGCAGQADEAPEALIEETHQNEIIEVNGLATIANPENIAANINQETRLSESYIPPDLVVPNIPFSFEEDTDKRYMRQEAGIALERLFDAAKGEGLRFIAISGYRSFERQSVLYQNAIEKDGPSQNMVAKPGYSEHQTGLAMDVSTASVEYELIEAFGLTAEGLWLEDHAHEYGYIIRYPAGKEAVTGYGYEPWHLRYVGVDLAEELFQEGVSLDEYHDPKTGV